MSGFTSAPATSNPTMPPPPTNGTSDNMSTTTAQGLSADEIALYDRQIRLWGAQAQERIRSAKILLVSLRALGTEIAKNLTLAGINSLTIIDDELLVEEDLGAQYFVRAEDIGRPRAQAAIPRIQELNPRVTVTCGGKLKELLAKDQTYYEPFDCVIACNDDINTINRINAATRVACRPFYSAGIHGLYGYIFADLVAHEYVVEREKSNIPTSIGAETITRAVLGTSTKNNNNGKTIEIVKKQEIYCPLILANTSPLPTDILNNRRKLRTVHPLLPCLRALFDFEREHTRLPGHTNTDIAAFTALATTKSRELQLPPETLRAEFLRSFLQNIGAEFLPTAAFVGGRLSEDVINVLGKREQPIQNFALFDGDSMEGKIYSLFTPPPELTMLGEMNAMNGMVGMSLNGGNEMATMGMGMGMGIGLQQMPDFMGQDGSMQEMSMDMSGMNGGMMPVDMNNSFATAQSSVAATDNVPLQIAGNGEAQDSTSGAAGGGADPTSAPADASAGSEVAIGAAGPVN